MRTFWLIPLLLLGCLQTAVCPPTSHDVFGSQVRITATPQETAPTPVDRPSAFQRLAETAQQHFLPGANKLFKTFQAPTSVLAPEISAGVFRFDLADHAKVLSTLARPLIPRAPPTTRRV